MRDPRVIRAWKVWRFLPYLYKESLFPKQTELPRTFIVNGTLALYYVIGNQHIIILHESLNLNDIFRTKVVNSTPIKLTDSLTLSDILKIAKATLEEVKISDTVTQSDSIDYKTFKRDYAWVREVLGLSEIWNIKGYSRAYGSYREVITLTDLAKAISYKLNKVTFTENVGVIETTYPARIIPRKWYLFRDQVFVVDGVFGGFPDPNYGGAMHYFRLIKDIVLPFEYQFTTHISLRKEEDESETVALTDSYNAEIKQVVRVKPLELVNITENVNWKVIYYILKNYQEQIALTEYFYYVWGVPIGQSLTKVSSNIYLEHQQVITDQEEALSKSVAEIILDHKQVIVDQEQTISKTDAIIELGHEQVITNVSQSMTKEVAGIEFLSGYYYYY